MLTFPEFRLRQRFRDTAGLAVLSCVGGALMLVGAACEPALPVFTRVARIIGAVSLIVAAVELLRARREADPRRRM